LRILEDLGGVDDLERRIESIYWFQRPHRVEHPLHFYPIIARANPAELMSNVSSHDPKFAAKITRLDDRLIKIDFRRRWGGRVLSSTAFLLSIPDGNVILSEDAKQVLLTGMISRLDPELSIVSMNSRDLLSLVERVRVAFEGLSCEVYYLTARQPRKQTIQAYNNVHLDQMREYVESGYWIERMKVRVRRDLETLFEFAVSRHGVVELYHGMFGAFRGVVLDSLLEAGHAKVTFYSNRGREPTGHLERTRPITIRSVLDRPLDKKVAKRLLEQIARFPKISYAIVHAGNPILLVHVVDDQDGSGYDIASTDTNVYIVPTFSATPSALMRAKDLVYSAFKEGVVEDYYEGNQEPSISATTSPVS